MCCSSSPWETNKSALSDGRSISAGWLLLAGCAKDGLSCTGLLAVRATSTRFGEAPSALAAAAEPNGGGGGGSGGGDVAAHAIGLAGLYFCATVQAWRRRWAGRAAAGAEGLVGQESSAAVSEKKFCIPMRHMWRHKRRHVVPATLQQIFTATQLAWQGQTSVE